MWVMNVFVIIVISMAAILIMLRMRKPVGLAMLSGGLLVWIFSGAQFPALTKSIYQVFTMNRTYELVFALYFVMCLEIQLRMSGSLKGMLEALQHWFNSDRITIALMPGVLGLLPSLGGAIFSAPMVQSLGNGLKLNDEQKSVINFWFRHITEYFSPINSGMLIASAILSIPLGKIILNTYMAGVISLVVGWFICIPKDGDAKPAASGQPVNNWEDIKAVFMTLSPVLFNFIFIVFLGGSAAVSMGIVTLGMFIMLALDKKKVPFWGTLRAALDYKLILNVTCILLFIQVLENTQTLHKIVEVLANSSMSIPVVIGIVSVLIGALTGMSQGHAAMVMPLVASLAPQDVKLAALAFVCGVAGQMVTPTHLCLIVTIDYFKADFFKTLNPVFLMQFLTTAIYIAYWLIF